VMQIKALARSRAYNQLLDILVPGRLR